MLILIVKKLQPFSKVFLYRNKKECIFTMTAECADTLSVHFNMCVYLIMTTIQWIFNSLYLFIT